MSSRPREKQTSSEWRLTTTKQVYKIKITFSLIVNDSKDINEKVILKLSTDIRVLTRNDKLSIHGRCELGK